MLKEISVDRMLSVSGEIGELERVALAIHSRAIDECDVKMPQRC
jgi:hypothetical protein